MLLRNLSSVDRVLFFYVRSVQSSSWCQQHITVLEQRISRVHSEVRGSQSGRAAVLSAPLPPPSTLCQARGGVFSVRATLQTKSMPWKSPKLLHSVGSVSGKTSHFFGGNILQMGVCDHGLCACVCVCMCAFICTHFT